MAIPNQAPDSSVAGFLQGALPPIIPGQTPPGQQLEDFLQQWVAGVAYMDGTLVRPRWQTEPPNLPEHNIDWASIGIIETRPIGIYPAVRRHPTGGPTGQGEDEVTRHEEFDLLVSFYGPHASEYAANLHSGLGIWQNYSILRLAGMAFVEIGAATNIPELIRMQWVNRVDKTLTIRRYIRRFYPVLNLLSAQAQVVAQDQPNRTYTVDVAVDPLTVWDAAPHTVWDDTRLAPTRWDGI